VTHARLVLRFVNDYRGWCRRRGLRPSRALARARQEVLGQLAWLHRLHEGAFTRHGYRRHWSLPFTDRLGDDFLHWRPSQARMACARRGRLVLRMGVLADARGQPAAVRVVQVDMLSSQATVDALIAQGPRGDEILSTWGENEPRQWYSMGRLSEETVWRHLESVPLTREERRALAPVVRALVTTQDARWVPCRTCRARGRTFGARWLVRYGRTLDCDRCRDMWKPWTRTRRAKMFLKRCPSPSDAKGKERVSA
jgi:hypothetical protein